MIRYFLIMAIAPSFYVSNGNECIKVYETKAALVEALKGKWFPGCILDTAQVFKGESLPLKFTRKSSVTETEVIEKIELK